MNSNEKMIPAPLMHSADYLKFAVLRRAHGAWVRGSNFLRRTNIQVAGEYFSGNLGDWAMGQVISRVGRAESFRPGLTGYFSGRTSSCGLIMGGGELGDVSHFERAIQMAGSPERVAACGINPVYTFHSFPEKLLNDIAGMPYLSVRSRQGAEIMREVLSRPDVEYNPDPAFCLYQERRVVDPLPRPKKRLAINLMTFYLSVQNRKVFAPDATMKSIVADPEFSELIDAAGEQYIGVMRAVIREALSQGWEVVNIPFSEVDAMFADAVLDDLEIERFPFSRDPSRVLQRLSTCQKFIATRFHAHVFGLIAGTPVASIAYSGKCGQLWADLGLDPAWQVPRIDICRDSAGSVRKLIEMEGAVMPPRTLADLSDAAHRSIQKAYASVGGG